MATLCIGDCLVEPDRLMLTGARGAQRIRKKDMALLLLLAERAPGVVMHEEIMATVWPRRVVPNVLPVTIARLRAALGADASIETVRGKGYRLAAPVTPAATLAAATRTPYRGLAPFTFEDAEHFFGRQAATREILAAVAARRRGGCAFVLVFGNSGSGKTSVVRAGVMPALVREAPAAWRHTTIDCAAGDPFVALAAWARDLSAAPADQAAEAARRPTTLPLAHADAAAASVAAVMKALVVDHAAARQHLLFCDHLELLFDDDTWDRSRRERLLRLLQALARSGRFIVLGAMRSDCFARVAESETLLTLTRGFGQYQLAPTTTAELAAIIARPALACGVRFQISDEDGTALDAQLLSDAAGAPDALPLLQYALAELYARRSPTGELRYADYRELDGLGGCIARRAEQIFSTLPEPAQQAFPAVLAALARPAGDGFVRRPRVRNEFGSAAQRQLIDAFVRARLFVAGWSGDGATVAVIHESLFRHWPRAAELLRRQRSYLAARQHLTDAARRWGEAHRSNAFCLAPGPLAEARELRDAGGFMLTPIEQSYLQASERRARRGLVLRRIGIAALASLSAALGLAAAIGFEQRARAEREAATSRAKSSFLVSLFSQGDPQLVGRSTLTARAMLDAAAQRLRNELGSDPLAQAAVLQTIGQAYMNIGAFADARPLLDDALALREARADADAFGLVETLNTLGKLAYYQSRHEEALQRYTRALDLATTASAGDHADTAQTLNNLGEVHLALAHYEQALAFHQRALDMRLRLFGTAHGLVASSWHNLAGVHRQSGRLDQAETLYRRAVALQLEAYGEDHLESAMGLSNLALLLNERGAYEEAADLFHRALAIRRRILPLEHPHMAHSLHNLGALLVNLERFEEAEPIIVDSIAAHRAVYGDKHIGVLAGQNNLATSLAARNRLRDAELHSRLAVDGFAELSGPRHPNTASIQSNLADILNRQGRHAEALTVGSTALETLQAALKKDHWRIAVARGVVAEARSGLGESTGVGAMLIDSYEAIAAALGSHSRAARRAATRAFDHFKRRGDEAQAARFAALVGSTDQRDAPR